jgi:hypothetical protein
MKPTPTIAKMLQVEVNSLVAAVDKEEASHLILGRLMAISAITQAALMSNAIPNPLRILRSMQLLEEEGGKDNGRGRNTRADD